MRSVRRAFGIDARVARLRRRLTRALADRLTTGGDDLGLGPLYLSPANPAIAVDRAGTVVAVNDAARSIFAGIKATDSNGRAAIDFVVPEDRERALQFWRHCLDSTSTQKITAGVLTANGVRQIACAMAPVERATGDTVYVLSLQDVTELEAARRALAEAHNAAQALISALPDAIFEISRSGGLSRIQIPENLRHACVGSEPTRVSIEPVGAPGAYAELLARVDRVLDTGEVATFDATSTQWPGLGDRVFEVRMAPSGADRVLVIARDVTEIRRTQLRLAESEARYRRVVDTQTEILLRVRPDGTVSFANAAYYRMCGGDPSSVIDRPVRRVLLPSDEERVHQLMADLTPDEPSATVTVAMLADDGVVRWQEAHYRGFFNEDGELDEVQVTGRDVTEQIEAERALVQSEKRLRAVLEAQTDMICRFSADAIITFANEPMAQMFGRPVEALIGSRLDPSWFHDDWKTGYRELMDTLSVDTPTSTADLQAVRPDGTLCWVRWTNRALFDDAGEIVEYQCVGADITERKLAEERLAESELQFRTLADSAPGVIFRTDASGACTYLNERWSDLSGQTNAEALGRGWLNVIVEDDVEALQQESLRARVETSGYDCRYRVRNVIDDCVRWVHTLASPFVGPDGEVQGMIGMTIDVTSQVELVNQTRRFGEVLENSPDYVMITDPAGNLLFANQSAQNLLGTDRSFLEVFEDEDQVRMIEEVLPAVDRAGQWSGEMNLVVSDEIVLPVSLLVMAGRNDHGEMDHFMTVARDVSELREVRRQLEHLARHDPLTQLPNRAVFMDRLAMALYRAQRNGTSPAVLFLDLDGFKRINDNYGHEAGDRVLMMVAHRLSLSVRQTDTVARLGGDEFVVLCEDIVRPEDVTTVAERIIREVTQPIDVVGGDVSVGTSIGIAFALRSDAEPSSVLAEADAAMYEAKTSGKGQYRVAEFPPGSAAVN
ncbi:MAG: PAS domain S-box protein [Acidimicrobiia bacterium]